MYCEPRPMTQFKILTYALHRCRSHFLASDPHVKLGGTNLQKKKLIRSALHLTMFAAQRFQPVAQRPLVAHVVSPDMLTCQLAATQLLVVKIPVFARCTTFPDSHTVLVDSNLHFCSCIHFLLIRVISDFATPHSDLGQRIRGSYQNVKDLFVLSTLQRYALVLNPQRPVFVVSNLASNLRLFLQLSAQLCSFCPHKSTLKPIYHIFSS